jgi:hypothetical protein
VAHPRRQGKTMHIPIPGPPLGFVTQKRGVLWLTLPGKKTVWNDETRWFRSLVYDREGRVVSAGLPKFMSPGRDRDTWELLRRADRDESLRARIRIYEKLDGSLIIRSVDRGRVLLRTRGSFDLGSFAQPVERYIAQHAPALLDPQFEPGASVLMEWCSPVTRVVVSHGQPSLTLLAAVSNQTLQELGREDLQQLARRAGLDLVREISYDGAMEDLPEWVDGEFGPLGQSGPREGVAVCVCDDAGVVQRRLRIKSEWYRMEHAMRFDYNPQAILRAFERVSRRSVKGKAKKRQRAADPVQAVLDELRVTHPALTAHVTRVCDQLAILDRQVDEEWERLLALSRKLGDDRRAPRRLGMDAVAASVWSNLGKKRGRAKQQLLEARRSDLLKSLAR